MRVPGPLERDVWDFRKTTTHFQIICKNPTKRLPQQKLKEGHRAEIAVNDMQQDSNTSDQVIDAVKTKTFNFHSVSSIFTTNLRSKPSQNIAEVT